MEKKNCAAQLELVSQLYNVKAICRVQIRRKEKEGENLPYLQGKHRNYSLDQVFPYLIRLIWAIQEKSPRKGGFCIETNVAGVMVMCARKKEDRAVREILDIFNEVEYII